MRSYLARMRSYARAYRAKEQSAQWLPTLRTRLKAARTGSIRGCNRTGMVCVMTLWEVLLRECVREHKNAIE
eukprot:6173465-Pleurochrysis_carterae.AAC.1